MAATELYLSPNKQLASKRVGNIWVQATGGSTTGIADSEWLDYLQYMKRSAKNEGAGQLMIQYSPDIAPSGRQRAQVQAIQDEIYPDFRALAILTDSSIVRGVITAMAWVSKNKLQTRATKPKEYAQALEWLQTIIGFDHKEALSALGETTKAVGYKLP